MELQNFVVILLGSLSVCTTAAAIPSNCSVVPSNASLVPCSAFNATKDQCVNQGCCWNSSSILNGTQCFGLDDNSTGNVTTASPPLTTTRVTTRANTGGTTPLPTTNRPPGTCVVYKGAVCDEWLNVTMLEYRLAPRFIDNIFGFNGTEAVIIEFMKAIHRIEGQEKCKDVLRALLCEYFLPPCDDKGVPWNYCREDCEAVFHKCNSAMREVLGAAKYIVDKLGLDFAHVAIPNCTRLRYLSEYKAENSSCLHFGLFNFTTVRPSFRPSSKPSKTASIAGAVAGSAAFLILVIIAVCVYKKRIKPKKLGRGFEGVTFTAVSMRDRIRAESLRALDQSKVMSLFNPDDIVQFPLSSVEYIRDLGSGNFGLVFLGRAYGLTAGKEGTELMVAIKTLKEGSSSEAKEDFFKEVALMSLLHHENIVELLAVSTEEEPYGMIFEFMDCGDLNQYLRNAGPFFEGDEKEKVSLTPDDLTSISLQCANGMEHLQMLRFVHRDIATRNCLVGSGLVVKISDFGMSRDIYASDYYKVEGQAVLPIRWMPPEALLYGKFTVESDIYSFGVLLWEIYTFALQPYYGYTNEEVVEFIKKGVHLGQPDDCPDHIYNIMKNCWNRDATQRPNFALMIAQIKQEVTSHYDTPELTLEPVSDKQPLYMNTTIEAEVSKGEAPVEAQATRKTSQQLPGGIQGVVNPSSAYVNVGYEEGLRSGIESLEANEGII